LENEMTELSTISSDDSDIVNSLLHPEAIAIRQLLTRTGRVELNRILIDDEENILQAIDAGVSIESVFFAGDEIVSDALKKKLAPTVKVHEVAKRTCKKIFENDKITRIFAIAKTPQYMPLESLLTILRDIVVLEDVSISGNIGAIIRTSLALGVGGIVLLNTEHVDIYDRRLIRASRGYVFRLPVIAATTEAFIQFSKQHNLQILVTNAHAEQLVHEISSLPQRLAIVFGSEKEGCSEALSDAASLQVRIPVDSRVESLNVSAAAGITLYNRARFNHIDL
jgi:23S rRNA (adenosine1067-2'-O)-methyltransferase